MFLGEKSGFYFLFSLRGPQLSGKSSKGSMTLKRLGTTAPDHPRNFGFLPALQQWYRPEQGRSQGLEVAGSDLKNKSKQHHWQNHLKIVHHTFFK